MKKSKRNTPMQDLFEFLSLEKPRRKRYTVAEAYPQDRPIASERLLSSIGPSPMESIVTIGPVARKTYRATVPTWSPGDAPQASSYGMPTRAVRIEGGMGPLEREDVLVGAFTDPIVQRFFGIGPGTAEPSRRKRRRR